MGGHRHVTVNVTPELNLLRKRETEPGVGERCKVKLNLHMEEKNYFKV